jgi:hypothetical protein
MSLSDIITLNKSNNRTGQENEIYTPSRNLILHEHNKTSLPPNLYVIPENYTQTNDTGKFNKIKL